MEPSTPLAKIVTEALVLGVYQGRSAYDVRMILFLARAGHASWTVNGRYRSVEEGLARHVQMPRETVRTALKRLTRAGVVISLKLRYATTYALSEAFLTRCRTLYDARWDLDAVESYHNDSGSTQTLHRVYVDPEGGLRRPPRKRALEGAPEGSATAYAGPPPGGGGLTTPGQNEPMDDDDEFYGRSKKRSRAWGGESDSPVLGEDLDRPLAVVRPIRSGYPSKGPVARTRERFKEQFQDVADDKKAPLWADAGKMHGNIKWLLEQQHVTDEAMDAAWRYFRGEIQSLVLGPGTSLWDEFFRLRADALRFAVANAAGSRGEAVESTADHAKRLAAYQQEQREKEGTDVSGEG